MKRSLILSLVLSAMLLTGCDKETELIDDLQTSEISSTQTLQAVQTETKIAETAGETNFIFGGETEISALETETETEKLPENMRLFDMGKLNAEKAGESVSVSVKNSFLNGNILCALCEVNNEQGRVRDIMRFYNIDSETIEETVRLPDSYHFEEFIGGGDDILCKAKLTHYISRNGVTIDEYSVLTVKTGYSYDFSEYTVQNAALPRGGRNITQWYLDIIDADRDMKIVEGFEIEGDGYSPETTRGQEYMFPIDENRFVYKTVGHEYTPCFGIYDFETDTAADVPDSENLKPLGIHNGKIYSALSIYGEGHSDIFATDIETLETVKAMDSPIGDYGYFKMPESGDHIVCMHSKSERSGLPDVIVIVDPDTGDIVKEQEIPYGDEFHGFYSHRLFFADSDTAVIVSNNMDKALIIDIEK